jgi:outer membrane lipase/esterase
MFKTISFRTRLLLSTYFEPRNGVRTSRRFLTFAFAFVFGCVAMIAQAKDYTRIVVFGDSLSDTGNVTHLFQHDFGIPFPAPAFDYTYGSFTDGFDTSPASQKYFGVWIEQLAASMPSRPEVKNSLDGGTNYAYGFATTGPGTSVFSPTDDSFAVNVENMGQQITDYLEAKPKINNSTLFVIWGGANDLLHASSSDGIFAAAVQEIADIQRLIRAGATQFLVLNLPPLGLTPRINRDPVAAGTANYASAVFNYYLAGGLGALHDFYPGRHIVLFQLDVFSLFSQIAVAQSSFGLTNITDLSRGNPSLNPDTYLFWDDIHPTTKGHNILANAAIKLIASPQCDSLGMRSCAAAMH